MGEIVYRRSPNLSCCMSPSCVPVHDDYARIHATPKGHRARSLRKLLRKIVTESRNIYRPPKPITFKYDAVSYSQNFDEGCHRDEEFAPWRRQVVLRDLKVSTAAPCVHN
ncbi:Unknown protein [Striga hermonthica]|uniref:Uncharacterized protein n=1 Tax=Striga hermonthica TaxID=68872 RepID=A0A9N7RQI6_STRHE|nr:Unknown protein [Striga hermonthica]